MRAEPSGENIQLSIGGWRKRPRYAPVETRAGERETDFFRASADWVWETDQSLRLTALSPMAAGAIGRPVTELFGQQLTSLFRFCENEDGSLPILNAFAERRRFEGQRAEIRGGNGASYWLGGAPLIDNIGKFIGFRGTATHIPATSREAVADDEPPSSPPPAPAVFGERLDKALREPLDHIITHAEAIGAQKEGPLLDKYADYATDISSAGRHLLSLVSDLVDFQTIEQPGFAPAVEAIDLANVAREAAQLLVMRAVEKQVRIEAPSKDIVIPATGEHRRALQIVTNLVSNAIRYSPQGGTVRIVVGCKDNHAIVAVIDQGKGIAPADQARIFNKFERVDPSEPGAPALAFISPASLPARWAAMLSAKASPEKARNSR